MHTRLSDGKNSHEEMVEAAIKKGFNEIAGEPEQYPF
ncbi:hypothetical protein [Prolixibacter sp. SD074]